jgi:hypothetical protein
LTVVLGGAVTGLAVGAAGRAIVVVCCSCGVDCGIVSLRAVGKTEAIIEYSSMQAGIASILTSTSKAERWAALTHV